MLLRVATASIVLVAIWTPRVRGRPRRELVLAAVFGLVLAGMNLAFYESIDRIPLGTAVTIEFVGPLAVAVIGSRRPLDLVWVALALAGILALTQGGTHSLDGLGVALALIAGGLWGAYIILNGRVGRAYERGTGVALSMCIASVALLPVGIASGGSHLLVPKSLAIGAAVGSALLGDPVFVRAGGAAPDRRLGVRRADEPRARCRRARRPDPPGPVAQRARGGRDRARRRRVGRSVTAYRRGAGRRLTG